MLKPDAQEFARKIYTHPQVTPRKATWMTSPWPFTVWGIDLIKQLPMGKGRAQYAVVIVDYFTKWIEVETLATITTKKIYDFVYHSIICRYKISHKIVSDNGTQFDSAKFRKLCNYLGIKKIFFSVAQPQTNSQVKVINKTLKHNLKTKLENLKGAWVDQLPEVLWAYRTMTRKPIDESPFALTYGYKVMIPVEIGVGSLRQDTFEHDQNHVLQRIDLNLLNEKRDQACLRNTAYQRRVACYLNSKVKSRSFQTGKLVL